MTKNIFNLSDMMHHVGKKALASLTLACAIVGAHDANAVVNPQIEKLDRGLIVIPNGSQLFVSWRMLATDDEDRTTFTILRNGAVVKRGIYETNASISPSGQNEIQIVTEVDGIAVDTTAVATPWGDVYKSIQLDRPAETSTATYTPNDCSVGDVDGDGEYELFVKWDPSNSKDNSQSGVTDKVYIDCYKFDGTKLWRIDLGVNIRAGAHYTQFLVYDFDGDGKAEMICKTAPGTLDGSGQYVNQATDDSTIKAASNTKSWRTSDGRINGGHEYLTVFEGATGKAINTIFYNPNRNTTSVGSEAEGTFNWDDRSGKNDKGNYGNRGERYIAAVAHLDGADKNASAIMCRGYYTYAFFWAVDFDGQKLQQKWFHASRSRTQYQVTDANGKTTTYAAPAATGNTSGSRTAYANGNHNMTCGDVDGDGCDEILWGSCAINNDGKLMYATGYGHGDAIHLGNFNPDRPGYEVFQVHEESPYGWDLHDAATGEVLFSATGTADNGRGICAFIDKSTRGGLFASSNNRGPRSCITGKEISTNSTSLNYRIFWDGDLYEELLDGSKIDKWQNGSATRLYINGKNPYDYASSSTCNGSKNTPCLQADIFGDWREEIILWDGSDPSKINIFSTITSSVYRMPTLMHEHNYRLAVAWQNSGYNQPPHIAGYLPDMMLPRFANDEKVITINVGDSVHFESKGRYTKSVTITASYEPDGTRYLYKYPTGFTKTNTSSKEISFKGLATQAGDYKFCYRLTGLGDEKISDTITVRVLDPSAVESIEMSQNDTKEWFTVSGGAINITDASLGMIEVSVFDVSGKLLMKQRANAASTKSIAMPSSAKTEATTVIIKVEKLSGTRESKAVSYEL